MNTIETQAKTVQGSIRLSKKEARQLCKVKNRGKWRSHLEAIGLDPDEQNLSLNWTHLRLWCVLQEFLKVRWGVHSVEQFKRLREAGLVNIAIKKFHLKPSKRFKELKHDYYQN